MRLRVQIIIIFVFFPYGSLFCQTDKIEELINSEIFIMDKLYSGQFFIEIFPESLDKVLYLNHTVIYYEYKDASISIIKTECLLDSTLFQNNSSIDTLYFYSFKIDGKYYRLFGFMFSDVLQMEFENPYLKREDFVKAILKSNILTKIQLKYFSKSLKKGSCYNAKIPKPIELLKLFKTEKKALTTIILPINLNQFIILD